MKQPLVSIIIPAYNADFYLEESLNSVKSQTYQNWELIVVEDGSQDRTEEIIKAFKVQVKERNVHYIRHKKNQGVSATRNTGMEAINGLYIAFLDADDLWQENHLEIAIQALKAGRGDLIYSTVQMFKDGTEESMGYYGPTSEDLEDFPNSLFTHFNYIQPSTIVMRREIVSSVGFFDKNLKSAEDSDYLLRVADAKFNFLHLETITCSLRRGHGSMTSRMDEIKEYYALVLRKHRNIKIISPQARQHGAMVAHLSVAKDNLRRDPLKSIEFFTWAWLIQPRKIKYVGGILLATLFYIFLQTKMQRLTLAKKILDN